MPTSRGSDSTREFAERFPLSRTEVDPTHLQPTKRAFVYEVPAHPPLLSGALLPELQKGAPFVGGSVLYVGADPDAGLLVVVFATSIARSGAVIPLSRTCSTNCTLSRTGNRRA